MFVFQDDTFDTFSHPCLLPSCSGVASKTLRTHLRLSTLATPATPATLWLVGKMAKKHKKNG